METRYLLVVALNLAFVAGMLTVGATQETKPARIVALSRSAADVQPLREGLRELGHVDGRTYTIELRHAGGSSARLRELANQVARSKPDIIYAPHGVAAAAARSATSTIPIVFISSDPVADGLVKSIARPGGNATGLATPIVDLSTKRMQLLREAFPGVRSVAVLFIPDSRASLAILDGYKRAGTEAKLEVLPVAVRSDGDLEAAFETVRRQRAEAITHISTPLFSTSQSRIIAFAAERRIPAISDSASFVRKGGLMSYGAGPSYNARRAAIYIDKILNGAKPADLPVEYPTRFEMAINLKTAKELGLTLAPSVISRADQVIQ